MGSKPNFKLVFIGTIFWSGKNFYPNFFSVKRNNDPNYFFPPKKCHPEFFDKKQNLAKKILTQFFFQMQFFSAKVILTQTFSQQKLPMYIICTITKHFPCIMSDTSHTLPIYIVCTLVIHCPYILSVH